MGTEEPQTRPNARTGEGEEETQPSGMNYLPDTDVLINALQHAQGWDRRLAELVRQGAGLACCAVTVAELLSGVHPAQLDAVEAFLGGLRWLETTPAIARRAGRLRYQYARRGTQLGLADTLIAATAMEYGLTLITGNRRHFPMPELWILPA